MSASALKASDLVRLADQIEKDRDAGWQELHRRDAAIGARCTADEPAARLLCWLRETAAEAQDGKPGGRSPLSERSAGLLLSGGFLIAGFLTMVGFLFAHGQGMVNVLWFFAFFVLLQLAMSLFSAATLVSVALGNAPSPLSINPARLLASRTLPDWRRWREFQDVIQLVFLRYGQGMGIGFVGGALLAFIVVPAVNDFSFMWSSTFQLTDSAMQRFVHVVTAPWSQWLPAATVDAQVITDSRYQPAAARPGPARIESMRSWWPFLFMSMLVYALLPRLLLGWLSRRLYRRRLQRAFIGYPGADLILRRMKQPLIQSQGAAGSEPRPGSHGELLEEFRLPDDGVLVISWAGALDEGDLDQYRELRGTDPAMLTQAGTSLEADRAAIDRARQEDSQLLILVVKAWEPPMSDLADFIVEIARGGSSVLFLQPLRDTGIPEDRLDDWRRFADELPGGAQVVAMTRLPAGARPAQGGSNGTP
ncbi:MAG: DUF2868 domain-containing protein [Halioglobus sp.]